MGYYSTYICSVAKALPGKTENEHYFYHISLDTQFGFKHVNKLMREIDEWFIDNTDWDLGMPFDDSLKWYNYEGDMIELSKAFPEWLFRVYYDGEDSDDAGYDYFYQGKRQNCHQIVRYPEFNYNKLKTE
jgi:hypothetical protein